MAMESLRIAAKESKILKFVFGIFIFLAVGGLVFTDVRGYFSGGVSNTDVAKIGDTTLTLREFDNDLRAVLQQTGLSSEEAYNAGLISAYLEGRVNNILKLQAAQDLNLIPDNALIAAQIRGVFGGMPRDQIEAIMKAQGLTEAGLANSIRVNIMTQYVTAMPLSVANYVPEFVKDADAQLNAERRSGKTYTVSLSDLVATVDVSDGDIQNYYNSHEAEFTIPENRRFTVGTMDAAMAKKDLPVVTDEDVRAAYDANKEDFIVAETRSIAQVTAKNPDDAQAIYEQTMTGESLEDAVKDVIGSTQGYKGSVSYQEKGLPDDLAEKAFASTVKKGDVTPPVKTLLGYTVMQVTDITPETMKPFDAIKDSLKAELKQTQVYDALYNKLVLTETMIDNDMSFDDIVKDTGLKTQETETYTKSDLMAGAKGIMQDIVSVSPGISDELFGISEGYATYPLELNDEQYAVIGVSDVTEAQLKALDDVRDSIISKIKAEKRQEMAENLLAAELKNGEAFKAPAKAIMKSFSSLGRGSDNPYVDLVYSTPKGQYSYRVEGDKAVIVTVENVSFADARDTVQSLDMVQQQAAIIDSLLSGYYRDNTHVKINEELLKATYGNETDQ